MLLLGRIKPFRWWSLVLGSFRAVFLVGAGKRSECSSGCWRCGFVSVFANQDMEIIFRTFFFAFTKKNREIKEISYPTKKKIVFVLFFLGKEKSIHAQSPAYVHTRVCWVCCLFLDSLCFVGAWLTCFVFRDVADIKTFKFLCLRVQWIQTITFWSRSATKPSSSWNLICGSWMSTQGVNQQIGRLNRMHLVYVWRRCLFLAHVWLWMWPFMQSHLSEDLMLARRTLSGDLERIVRVIRKQVGFFFLRFYFIVMMMFLFYVCTCCGSTNNYQQGVECSEWIARVFVLFILLIPRLLYDSLTLPIKKKKQAHFT